MNRRLDREAAERVIRRAVELSEEDEDPAGAGGVEVAALLAAAADIGVDPTSVYRAVAEEQAGLLADETPDRLGRLVGPATVSAARVVALAPGAAMDLLDDWLRRVWAFRRVRSTGSVAEYRRRTDAFAGLQRGARSLAGKEKADKVRSVRVVTHPIDAGHSLVALVVDLQGSRTYAEVGGMSLAASGSLVSVVSGLATTPWLWLGVPASAAAGVGVMATRRAWTQGVDVELEAVLDKVAAGEQPDSMLGDLRDRLLGGPTRGRSPDPPRERGPDPGDGDPGVGDVGTPRRGH